MPTTDELLDQLLMLRMGNGGNSMAHVFLEKCARDHPGDIDWAKCSARSHDHDVRCFIPPKEEDRVLMFADHSGVYVHASGLCTIMGTDISHEIHAWTEEERL